MLLKNKITNITILVSSFLLLSCTHRLQYNHTYIESENKFNVKSKIPGRGLLLYPLDEEGLIYNYPPKGKFSVEKFELRIGVIFKKIIRETLQGVFEEGLHVLSKKKGDGNYTMVVEPSITNFEYSHVKHAGLAGAIFGAKREVSFTIKLTLKKQNDVDIERKTYTRSLRRSVGHESLNEMAHKVIFDCVNKAVKEIYNEYKKVQPMNL